MALSPCPTAEHLQRLLADAGSGAEQESIIAHLDQCTICQNKLDKLAGADPTLLFAAGAAQRNGYADELPLRRLLSELQTNGVTTVVHRPLDRTSWVRSLLRPAQSVDSLGQLGEYDVKEYLGQGSMGIVVKAHDPKLKRWVAIKVLAPDLAGDVISRRRFQREAQAAAAVRHENVATIHAVSEANGLPFIVMEYIEGGSLQDYLDIHGPPDWREIVRLSGEIASGLAAAHAQGLIHRDIKPSNILVQTNGAKDALGISKIGDFGLAHVADESRLTQTGIVAGTPMYMSPEQAEGDVLDSRADLFSLGSLMYALCTGRDPFPGASPLAVLRQVVHATPRPISEINPNIPIWLTALVERLQAKHPADRCGSAAEVADLLRYNLAHPEQPRMVAPPPSRRSPWRAGRRVLAGVVGAAMLVVGGLAVRALLQSNHHRAGSSSAVTENQLPMRAALTGHTAPVFTVAFSPDGKFLATGSDDSTLRIWDAVSGKEITQLGEHHSPVTAVVFAHSGKFLLNRDGDGTLHEWEISGWKESGSFPHSNGTGRRMALSPDDTELAIPTTRGIELWDLTTRTHRLLSGQTEHQGSVSALAFAPDGQTLATGYTSGTIQLWDPARGVELQGFIADPQRLTTIAFTPDGRTLASAGGKGEVKLWEISNGKYDQPITTLAASESSALINMAISPDGHLLATGVDGMVMIWDLQDLASAQPLVSYQSGQGRISSLTFSPDNLTLATAGDRLVSLWDLSGLETVQP